MSKLIVAHLLLISSLNYAFTDSKPADEPKLRIIDYPIVSKEVINDIPEGFNKEISRAAFQKELWPFEPLSVVFEFLSERLDAQTTHLVIKYNQAENPSHVQVTIFQEGFLDDSISGTWKNFTLKRIDGYNPWRIIKIETANLCHRGDTLNAFQKESCP